LAAIERNFAPMAERQEIDFRIEADPAVPRTITADGDLLRDQVLGNLIGNAFKFTPAGGRIRVRAWVEEDDVLCLEVADDGPGIPADELPRIFDKFYQAGARRAKGSGLGLAIANEVMTAHGGEITVRSEAGKGTAFTIRMPIVPVTENAATHLPA